MDAAARLVGPDGGAGELAHRVGLLVAHGLTGWGLHLDLQPGLDAAEGERPAGDAGELIGPWIGGLVAGLRDCVEHPAAGPVEFRGLGAELLIDDLFGESGPFRLRARVVAE